MTQRYCHAERICIVDEKHGSRLFMRRPRAQRAPLDGDTSLLDRCEDDF